MKLDDELTVYEQVNVFLKLIEEQETEIKKREMIAESLKESLVKKIRYIGSFMPYTESMLNEAWRDKSSSSYKYIKNDLKEKLFGKENVKLESISPVGYDKCVYAFYFKCKGIRFCLSIPNTKAATVKNVYDMAYGMYRMTYERKPGVYSFVAKDYKLENIANAIESFLNDKEC